MVMVMDLDLFEVYLVGLWCVCKNGFMIVYVLVACWDVQWLMDIKNYGMVICLDIRCCHS